jgi:hypothetical protein
MPTNNSDKPRFSILIGRVSTEDHERVIETLDALRAQGEANSYEVIIVDRRDDLVTARILADYPEATLERCDAGATLPAMRARALELAQADYIIVTEDHCVPTPTWLADFNRALDENPQAGAIAGAVDNGVQERRLDWATYLCEYAAFAPPIVSGPTTNLAGMNVVYRRSALHGLPSAEFTRGFWETTIHGLILAAGYPLVADNRIVIMHCKRFSFRLFAVQRYVYSRYFGGIRFPRSALLQRAAAAAACVLIPVLMTYRLLKSARAKPSIAHHTRRAAPILFVFYVIWAVGEAVGYLFGPGDALAQIE